MLRDVTDGLTHLSCEFSSGYQHNAPRSTGHAHVALVLLREQRLQGGQSKGQRLAGAW